MSPTAESMTTLRPGRRLLDTALLAGLAGDFLVNALVAFLQPLDVTGIVERSVLGRAVPAHVRSGCHLGAEVPMDENLRAQKAG